MSVFSPAAQALGAQMGVDMSQVGNNEFVCLQQLVVLEALIAQGGGGGSGITQLTGDVTAGPGSGSVASSIVKLAGMTVDSVGSAPAAGTVLYNNGGTLAGAAGLDITSGQVTGITNTGPAAMTFTAMISSGGDSVTFTSGGRTDVNINGTGDISVLGFSRSGTREWNIFDDGALHIQKTGLSDLMRFDNSGSVAFSRLTANGVLVTTASNGTVNVVAQSTPQGNTLITTLGSGTPVLQDTTFAGGTGATAYCVGDLVTALKNLGLITA